MKKENVLYIILVSLIFLTGIVLFIKFKYSKVNLEKFMAENNFEESYTLNAGDKYLNDVIISKKMIEYKNVKNNISCNITYDINDEQVSKDFEEFYNLRENTDENIKKEEHKSYKYIYSYNKESTETSLFIIYDNKEILFSGLDKEKEFKSLLKKFTMYLY